MARLVPATPDLPLVRAPRFRGCGASGTDAAQKRRVELGCPHLNTYGSRMHPNDGRVVSIFVIQALLGQDITVYGDGS